MAMNVGSGGDEDEVVSHHQHHAAGRRDAGAADHLPDHHPGRHADRSRCRLPKETNIARQTKPENIEISVNKDGDVFWNAQPVADNDALFERLKKVAVMNPQPEVHIRGDEKARYESIGRVVFACQRAAIPRSASSPNRRRKG